MSGDTFVEEVVLRNAVVNIHFKHDHCGLAISHDNVLLANSLLTPYSSHGFTNCQSRHICLK